MLLYSPICTLSCKHICLPVNIDFLLVGFNHGVGQACMLGWRNVFDKLAVPIPLYDLYATRGPFMTHPVPPVVISLKLTYFARVTSHLNISYRLF